jgi:protein kinase-like protein
VIGETVGNYRIVAELGHGGMGVVYRGEHVQLGRPAAVKMLQPQFSRDPTIVQRFFNEARAASSIDHPGIVEIFDFGTHYDGRAYIIMALLSGESLERRLQRGPLAPVEGSTLIAQVAAALAAAHARGIVHRDLKPDNIFLVPNELMPGGVQAKLLDFGIAKLADEQTAGFKTQTGALIGTPAYMSPEQCMGRSDLDHRTDLYSLGCILFHVLCGRPPFTSDQGTGVMIAAHLRDPAPHPRSIAPHVPDALAAIVMRLLEKEPGARFQSASELRDALVHAGANAPLTKPRADGYAATMASAPPGEPRLTTGAGSAGQLLVAAPRVRSRKGLWIGLGALVLVAGGATAAVLILREPDAPAPAQPAVAAPVADPCPSGQVRGTDTQGRCCWKGQAWSNANARCVGAPTCPAGMTVRDDQCVVVVVESGSAAAAPPQPPAVGASKPAAQPLIDTTAPKVTLDAASFPPSATIHIKLASPIASPPKHRAWITVSEAGSAPSSYGAWSYLDDGATSATLAAPAKTGNYEVRLHTDYPTRSYNVQQRVPFQVTATGNAAGETPRAQQRFRVAKTTVRAGQQVKIAFPTPLRAAAGERFWVTIIAAGAADTAYDAYEYVPDGARAMQLAGPTKPGSYEVRLHANYPTLATNLVFREAITVEP